MPVDKIDSTKYIMPINQPVQNQQGELSPPVVQDEEKSNAAKYMIGATAIAATVSLGIIGHKNWSKLASNTKMKIPPQHSLPSQEQQHFQVVSFETEGEKNGSTIRRKEKSKLKGYLSSPFKAIRKYREQVKLRKQAELEKQARLAAEQNEKYNAQRAAKRLEIRQALLEDEPNRLMRIAEKEKKYEDKLKLLKNKDFGEIKVLSDDTYSRRPLSDFEAHPGKYAPLPKRGEYTINNFAVDGYWNSDHTCGASSYRIPGADISYINQFTLHDDMYLPNKENIHWAMQRTITTGSDNKFHLGTLLRFSAPEFAVEKSRPLGWNIFIEGNVSLEKMNEIKKQLVDSGALARQIAIQDDDTIIEVFNEIIKVLNR